MVELIATSERLAVIGMGQTGFSVANFLARNGIGFMMFDTRDSPPNKDRFTSMFPNVACACGPLDGDLLTTFSKIVVSPGVDVKETAIAQAQHAGVPVIGDIQLFVERNQKPLVAITGSNGKSTVTTLVGEMMLHAGRKTAVAGNIGTPVLDFIDKENEHRFDSFVLELSSFQLESTTRLNADVAVVLNVSEDHMDRYPSLQAYYLAKQRIFYGAKHAVVNRQDPLSQPLPRDDMTITSFGLDVPDLNQFGIINVGGERFLARGIQKLLNAKELKIRGSHNVANVLAALAIGEVMGLSLKGMIESLLTFTGLPHRCQWVAELGGVEFVNDSKGTNVGATLAALNGLSQDGKKIVLIAGGDGKGADFSSLATPFANHVKALIAIGRDGQKLIDVARAAKVEAQKCENLDAAVARSLELAESGDIVLLSPACASFDMFKNYVDRGEQFCRAVKRALS